MALSLDIFECQNATPLFRSRISYYEEASMRLEARLKKIVTITKSISKLILGNKTKTQKHKNTKTQKHKNTKTQKHKNTKIQKHKNELE